MDFTLTAYTRLLQSLISAGYSFQTFEQYIKSPKDKVVILRHDVDLRASNSLLTAEIEYALGVVSSYYFRIIPQSNQPDIIRAIASLGHEIGYHYEDLALTKGDTEKAIQNFKKHLTYFRKFYPVSTICMHGSPLSRFDNRELWHHYNYREYGVMGEPFFDIDFAKVLYLTDTGRRWDGDKVSVRDKPLQKINNENLKIINLKKTNDIVKAAVERLLPQQIMITTHPQRWTNNLLLWTKELMMQNGKNLVKAVLVKRKKGQGMKDQAQTYS